MTLDLGHPDAVIDLARESRSIHRFLEHRIFQRHDQTFGWRQFANVRTCEWADAIMRTRAAIAEDPAH